MFTTSSENDEDNCAARMRMSCWILLEQLPENGLAEALAELQELCKFYLRSNIAPETAQVVATGFGRIVAVQEQSQLIID